MVRPHLEYANTVCCSYKQETLKALTNYKSLKHLHVLKDCNNWNIHAASRSAIIAELWQPDVARCYKNN